MSQDGDTPPKRIRVEVTLVFECEDEDHYQSRMRVITESLRELHMLFGGNLETEAKVSIV